MDGVKFEKVSSGLCGAFGVVDTDELEIGVVKSSTENEPTDSAEAIDGDFDGHGRV